MQKPGKVYLIPNLLAPETQPKAIPSYNLQVIKELKYFLVEDLRNARRFISSLKLGITIDTLHFSVLDKRTQFQELKKMFSPISAGNSIGIISEAGCPGIADPGALAVSWAHQQGIEVHPLVGPSSILLALMASGMNGQSFVFHGYLPIKAPERKQKIIELEKNAQRFQQTQIFMETPYRNNQLLKSLLETCRNETRLCIAANINANEELIKTKKIKTWKNQIPDLHKIPTIFLLET